MTTLISEKELEDLCEQLNFQHRDKDRERIIKAASNSWDFTSAQVAKVISIIRYGNPSVNAGILLYSKVTDKDNYSVALDAYDYEEEKQKVREALGI